MGPSELQSSSTTSPWREITEMGIVINPYDECVANKVINRHQITLLWYVDDLNVSYEDEKVLDKFVDQLRSIYDDEEIRKIKVNKGSRHSFVGMTLDYIKK